jgi:hypothetical protein
MQGACLRPGMLLSHEQKKSRYQRATAIRSAVDWRAHRGGAGDSANHAEDHPTGSAGHFRVIQGDLFG